MTFFQNKREKMESQAGSRLSRNCEAEMKTALRHTISKNYKKEKGMYVKKVLFLTLFLSLMLGFGLQGFTQSLDSDYDRREAAVDPFEDEDKILREKKITDIINRIRRGDRTVLRLVVFDTLEAVHDEVVRSSKGKGHGYYDALGGRTSLNAFIGGFDNQDPKVRLKCIGYLGDYVDEKGSRADLNLIEKAVDKRIATNIETRKEVRYGFRVLKMKIVRKKVIAALQAGDQKILVRIAPEEFLPLVFYEPRIRTIYLGAPGSVRIRSIVLDPGIQPETGAPTGARPGRAQGLDIERICYTAVKSGEGDTGEVAQWIEDVRKSGGVSSARDVFAQGGGVGGGNSGAASAGGPVAGGASFNARCVSAILAGLDNKSLFVRENSIRIFLNYVRGYTGDANYPGSTRVKGGTRKSHDLLVKMAKNPYWVRLAQVAWDNVKWSEYYYNDRVAHSTDFNKFVGLKYYMEFDPSTSEAKAKTSRYFTEDVKSYAEWGTEVSGNYRNDVKELLRILGLSWYIDAEYVFTAPTGAGDSTVKSRSHTLFNDEARSDRPRNPDRSDTLEGESDTSFNPAPQK